MLLFPDWTPQSLFASGEQGAWYDFGDISTLWQDTARTTPVTAVGQTVAGVTDKSGRGNHLSQPTAARRPVYQVDAGGRGYLQFDSTDDGLQAAAFAAGSDQMFMVLAIDKLGSNSVQTRTAVEFSANSFSNNGTFGFFIDVGGITEQRFRSRGTAEAVPVGTFANAAGKYVFTFRARIGGSPEASYGLGVTYLSSVFTSQGTGNYGNYALNIGSRDNGAATPSGARFYGCILRFGSLPSSATQQQASRWMNKRIGVAAF